ncbi:MAG: hypothetical protein GXP39_13170 [Chloroflexi bacterium]|nr:hypothetical protein [Chloroflexota bacterium]
MRRICQEQGSTLTEYALILAMILVIAVTGLSAVGQSTQSNLETASNAVATAVR